MHSAKTCASPSSLLPPGKAQPKLSPVLLILPYQGKITFQRCGAVLSGAAGDAGSLRGNADSRASI